MIISGNSSINKVYYSGYTISKIYACGGSLVWEDTPTPPTPSPYEEQYLTFRLSSTYPQRYGFSGTTNTIDYSLDSGTTWSTLQSGQFAPEISNGETIMWRGSDMQVTSGSGIGNFCISANTHASTEHTTIEGNIMSIIHGDNFKNATSILPYQFLELFRYLYSADDAENLILPSTTLKPYCYKLMLANDKITKIPVLSATTLAEYCYESMFAGTSITTAPELPATTLAEGCYANMFYACSSLTTAPILSATTLANYCYDYMFMGCTSLTTAPELPATTLARHCYGSMFKGCSSLTTAPILSATTLDDSCYHSMFENCTSLTKAPTLPATTLPSYCYGNMFKGCTRLNEITCLATDISATWCTHDWTNNVSVGGIFKKNPNMSSWTTGTNGIPQYWDVVDAS